MNDLSSLIFKPGAIHPEEEYLEFEKLSGVLGIPVPMVRIKVEATNPDGSQGDCYEGRMRTWNRNYWTELFRNLGVMVGSDNGTGTYTLYTSDTTFGAGHLTAKQTNGTVLNSNAAPSSQLAHLAPSTLVGAGEVNYGIVVGTGTGAEDFEGYALGAKVAHGTGTGQLSYAAMALNTPSYNAGTKAWTSILNRAINNNSGGTIVVGETGIIGTAYGSNYYWMVERSLLPSTVSVLNGGQLTVTYTMTLIFPN